MSPNNNFCFFYFDPVSPDDIEREILSIPKNKAYALYSCPIRILFCAKRIVSVPLADIFNMSVQNGWFPSKLKEAKVISVYKSDDETEPGNRPFATNRHVTDFSLATPYWRASHSVFPNKARVGGVDTKVRLKVF